MTKTNDFDTAHLKGKGKKAAELILKTARSHFEGVEISGGGCKAFYTAKEWKDRGENYGTSAVLIIVHDGGDLTPFFNLDYGSYKAQESMMAALDTLGLYSEMCTGWYTAIYEA